ncbi:MULTISPECIES: diaminobutyrate--2-oxoglutarate transaminase [unclassified Niallia]|uniref:diaminobutyrate--2-oxoglutarate transaminase n=1 Tax=unclassified Niallia TaxID=2837522 RepID=UPI0030F9B7CF
MSTLNIIEDLESGVRNYVRSFPTMFVKAKGYRLYDHIDREYIDFFSGAGALNYGHNNPKLKEKLLEYIINDNITHSLDMASLAKTDFIESFNRIILKPRGLEYRMMFTGPTGTNAVESAIKLARNVTGRHNVMAFTNAFHGMTLGSLALNGNKSKRKAGIPLNHVLRMPYDGYFGEDFNTLEYIDKLLSDPGSGMSLPAAVILETVQGEGGLHSASIEWLKGIERICRKYGMLLIVDDIQVGCGRTGSFFSFENAGIIPDIICLSKSISGYGLPMALNLIKQEYDVWSPGEHNGTFRGNNLAFITAAEALKYWEADNFSQNIKISSTIIEEFLDELVRNFQDLPISKRGRGMIQGLAFEVDGLATTICSISFSNGLLIETSGSKSDVIKLIPPLTIDQRGLEQGLNILNNSINEALFHTSS